MNILWVGTGSSFNAELGNTSFVVDEKSDRLMLIECGVTVPSALTKMGLLERITDVLVTHLHGDHVGGLESLGFWHLFLSKRPGDKRPRLHVASDDMAQRLWENTLKGGMGHLQDREGLSIEATLETYFRLHIGKSVEVESLPKIEYRPARHVAGMECYGLRFANGVYYSGDTTELPPGDASVIFQDCRFGDPAPGEIHISYEQLRTELPAKVKRRTHLVHLGDGYRAHAPQEDGFAGFVLPGQRFSDL